MQIYGDKKYSDKFYVYLDDKSIKYVKSLGIAKSYVNNIEFKDWYNKDIYCTNEEVVKAYNGKFYLKSQCPEDPKNNKIYNNKNLFIENAKKYIDKLLQKLANDLKNDSFYTLISWKDSEIEEFKNLAKKALIYRDRLYTHLLNILEKYKNEFNNEEQLTDISIVYSEFLDGIPKFEDE